MNEQKKLEIKTIEELLYKAHERCKKLFWKETSDFLNNAKEILTYLENSKWVSIESLKQLLNEFPDMNNPKYWVELREKMPKIEGRKPDRIFVSLKYIGDVLNWKKQFDVELSWEEIGKGQAKKFGNVEDFLKELAKKKPPFLEDEG